MKHPRGLAPCSCVRPLAPMVVCLAAACDGPITVGAGAGLAPPFDLALPPLAHLAFQPLFLYAPAAPQAVAVADLDADGWPDLVSVGQGTTLDILWGGPKRTFAPYVATGSGGTGAVAVTAARIDEGATLDLVVANQLSSAIAVLPGDGHRGFGTPVVMGPGIGIESSGVLATVAIEGHHRPDVISAEKSSNAKAPAILFLANLGGGQLGAPVKYPLADVTFSLAIDDFNGDGNPDVAAGQVLSATVALLPGAGESFAAPIYSPLPAGYTSDAIAAGRLDGDLLDLVAVDNAGGLVVLHGDGGGHFDAGQVVAVDGMPSAVALADLDRDGSLDAITANPYGNDVAVLLGDGAGHFAPPRYFPVGRGPGALAVADLDGDQRLDVVVADTADGQLAVLYNTSY